MIPERAERIEAPTLPAAESPLPAPPAGIRGDFRAEGHGLPVSVEKVVEEQQAYLLRVARSQIRRYLGARSDPSDIVQQTCLEALRDSGGFQGLTEASVKAWLRTILLNNIRSHMRRHSRS